MGVRVLIADDHVMVRQGLRALLDREGFDVVGEASNGQEAVDMAGSTQPDVAVMDVSMPIMNGVEAAQELARHTPLTRCILLTRHDDDQYVLAALRAGVRGYVLKSQAAIDLSHAIREVSRGQLYLSPGISKVVIDAFLSAAMEAKSVKPSGLRIG
jgi:DNA-binding NarL/FixJ family response regulator